MQREHVATTLKSQAQNIIRQQGNDQAYSGALSSALTMAHLYATECRRHLNPGAGREAPRPTLDVTDTRKQI